MADLGAPEFRQAPKWSKHESADGVRVNSGPFVGIVKANTDPTYSGKLQVYITELGGDPTDDKSWRTVSYSTPFYGVTNHRDSKDFGGSPHSYGMWFVPPDIGVKVLVTFVNGDPLRGYWFACIPEWPYQHMIPGISAPVDGSSPAPATDFYGDTSDPNVFSSANKLKKLPHDVQQQIWQKQGLLQDPDRGPGKSSVFRETPSAVFGISTPGKPLDPNDPQQYPDPDNPGGTAYGVRGRKGGHTFVMDDGDVNGDSQMVRLRTAAGHMIMMNDSKDFMYVINSKGTAWVEINSQGDINVYSESKVNISANSEINLETKGALKLHGDTVDIKSEKGLNIEGKDVNILGSGTTKLTGKTGLHLKGKNTYLTGDDCIQVLSSGHIDIKGSCVTLNTAAATKAMEAGTAQTPSSPMPSKEPWTGHKAAANPTAQPTFGSSQGLPTGASGKYGSTSNYGSGTQVQQSYGPMTNNIPPTVYNNGPQGSFAGQSSIAAQYIPAGYTNGGQIYTVLSNVQNITYGTGSYFDISSSNRSGEQTNNYSVGELQNNPGNLQYSTGDKFAVGFANNLAVYTKPEDGIAALMVLFDSYNSNAYLTSVQYCQYYLQASDINDNRVVSMARYIQNLIGVNSSDYVTLSDPTTRIAWASAVISFVQGRIIYTYNQVLAGCAASVGESPSSYAQKAQPVTQPWQNGGGNNTNSGFINPAKNSSIANNGSSPLTQIATKVLSNLAGNALNNFLKGGATSNNNQGSQQHGSFGFVENTNDGARDMSTTTTTPTYGGYSGIPTTTPSGTSSSQVTSVPYYNGGGSGASFVGTPATNTNATNTLPGQSYYDPRTGQVITVTSSGDGSVAQTAQPAGDAPSIMQQQSMPDTSFTPVNNYSFAGNFNTTAQQNTNNLTTGFATLQTPTSPIAYTSQTLNGLEGNNPTLNGPNTPSMNITSTSFATLNSGTGVSDRGSTDYTISGGGFVSGSPYSVTPVAQDGGNSQSIPLPIPRPGNLNEPIANPNDANGIITSDPRKGEGTLSGGYNDPVQPVSSVTSTANGVRPEYDPTTGKLINQPVTGQTPAAGSGSAAGGGGQNTPQGTAATGQAAGSC